MVLFIDSQYLCAIGVLSTTDFEQLHIINSLAGNDFLCNVTLSLSKGNRRTSRSFTYDNCILGLNLFSDSPPNLPINRNKVSLQAKRGILKFLLYW